MPDEPVLEADIVRTLPGFSLALAFSVQREVLVLFGPSGAGKSLVLQALAGIDRPDGGRIVLRGGAQDLTIFDRGAGIDLRPQARGIGYVPQSLALFPHLSVAENVTYGLRRLSQPERARRARRLIALMRLQGLEDRRPAELSGGQQQRVALARALAVQPRLLLLDEPFSAVDRPTRGALAEEVRRLHAERGIPVVLVTHDLEEAFAMGDRVAVLDAGRLLQIGAREEIFARPATRRVAELVGVENVLSARVRDVAPGGGTVVEWGSVALVSRAVTGLEPGEPVALAIAAAQVMVLKEEADGLVGEGDRVNVLPCRTLREEPGRETVRLDLQVRGTEESARLRLELPTYAYYRLGLDRRREFSVQLKPEWLHVMSR